MHHTMQISVSKKPKNSVAVVRRLTGREKLMHRLFGSMTRMTVIVPGDTVEEVSITEVKEGDESDEQDNQAQGGH